MVVRGQPRFTRAEKESGRCRGGVEGREAVTGCGRGRETGGRVGKGAWCIDLTGGRGLIHRGGRTWLHAVVERISFIAILDERDEPVTRLPRESQGREFPVPHSRDTRDDRESYTVVSRYGCCFSLFFLFFLWCAVSVLAHDNGGKRKLDDFSIFNLRAPFRSLLFGIINRKVIGISNSWNLFFVGQFLLS